MIIKLALITTLVNGFQPNIRTYKKTIGSTLFNVYEPRDIVPEETHSAVFFTGANGMIPFEIYDKFLMSLANKNISIHIGSSKVNENRDLLYDLMDEYKDVTIIGHSSGCVPTVKTANLNKKCKKAILLDPVNNDDILPKPPTFPTFNPFWGAWKEPEESSLRFRNIDSLLTIKAMNAYRWNLFGKNKVPFLLFFGLDGKNLVDRKVDHNIIEYPENGHTDILDTMWADVMHQSLSPGIEDRDPFVLNEYREKMANDCASFICSTDLEECNEESETSEVIVHSRTDEI